MARPAAADELSMSQLVIPWEVDENRCSVARLVQSVSVSCPTLRRDACQGAGDAHLGLRRRRRCQSMQPHGTMQDLRRHQRLHPAGGAACNIFANRIVSVNNGTGYLADCSGARVLLNNAVATANSTGVSAVNSGLTFTCKNNAINGNLSSDGTPTNQIPPE